MFTLLVLFAYQALASSSGSFAIDALGICSEPSSGAYNSSGIIFCPFGMHSVIPPVRTNAYTIRTDDGLPLNDPDEYMPDTIMDVHIRTHNRYMKYLGLMIYAVKAGTIPRQGCPGGCDGKIEEKVGSWEIVDAVSFRTTSNGQILTHAQAKRQRFHHVLRFVTPPAGTGPIIFRAILKQGATNGGAFYWPMMDGDLEVKESSSAAPLMQWISGPADLTCETICLTSGMLCKTDAQSDISVYSEAKYSTSCKLPLLNACLEGSTVNRDSDGYCTFHADSKCAEPASQPDVCGRTSSGAENVCPCQGGFEANESINPGAASAISLGAFLCFCGIPAYLYYLRKKDKEGKHPEWNIGMDSFFSKRTPKTTGLPVVTATKRLPPPPPPRFAPTTVEQAF